MTQLEQFLQQDSNASCNSASSANSSRASSSSGIEEDQENLRNAWGDENILDESNQPQNDDEDDDDLIELVVQGKEICVSEKLLCRQSKYFAHIFGTLTDDDSETVVLKHGKLDGEEDVPVEKQEEPLAQISYATMKTIVDYLEQGVLRVGEQNVKQLLMAADMLAIGTVETACFNFLKSNMNSANCVRHFVVADAKSSWRNLSRHCAAFIQVHFDELMGLTQVYQHTSASQFRQILSDESLNVQREEQVLEAVLEWVNYDQDSREHHLESLLDAVQWPLVRSKKVLRQALKNPLIAANQRCVQVLEEALAYHDLSYDDKVEYWQGKRRPSRWPKLLAALAYADKIIECFDFEEQKWKTLTEKPTATFGAEMTYLNGKLFTIGGVQTKQVDMYDLEANLWNQKPSPSLTQFRVAHGACTHGDQVYVMGGSAKASADFGPGLNEMECLSLGTENGAVEKPWSTTDSMKEGRSYLASAAGENDRIYVVGGCLSEKFSSAEAFNLKTGKWKKIAHTLTKRDSLGLALFDGGQIYAVGGYNNLTNSYLNTVERYDPWRDAWFKVKPMVHARRSPGVVAYRGKLYVVGGMGQTDDLRSTEVYDPMVNQWSRLKHSMKDIRGWVTCCLVDKPLRLMKSTEDAKSSNNNANKDKRLNYRATENSRTTLRMKQRSEFKMEDYDDSEEEHR